MDIVQNGAKLCDYFSSQNNTNAGNYRREPAITAICVIPNPSCKKKKSPPDSSRTKGM
jgi:hypothetical protein